MGGFLVLARGGLITIDLDQKESRRVIVLLDHIEAGDARLAHAVTRILDRCLAKGLDGIRLDLDMNKNDEHDQYLLRWKTDATDSQRETMKSYR